MTNPKLTKEELEKLNKLKSKPKPKTTDTIAVSVPKGFKEIWKSEAETEGKTLSQFVSDAVDFYIDNK